MDDALAEINRLSGRNLYFWTITCRQRKICCCWREDERIVELDRNENAEQYRLIARSAGYYPCFLCPEKKIWLSMGETAKIGITTNRSVRYTSTWLDELNLDYFVDVIGDLSTVRKAEINKIADYPVWLENRKRPEAERLVVPPLHKTVRLK